MKFAAISMLALPLLAVATTTPTIPGSQCNVNDLKCCNSTQESDALTAPLTTILALLGINLSGLFAQVGLTCSGLQIIGGGSSCTAQPVCCSNNSFNGIVALGCSPINVSL